MITQTIEKLKSLKLAGFVHALREQTESTQYQSLSFDERLGFLVDSEFLRRSNLKVSRTIKEARLKQQGTVEDVDFDTKRGLGRSTFMDLAQCSWIRQAHNLIISGPTGVGKSFLACALADKACKLNLKAQYVKASDLVSSLQLARADGSYAKMAAKFAKLPLLVIDEWLRDPLSQVQAREVLDLLDDRYRKASTIFCSQLPVPEWHQCIQDPTLADAILDRIVHDSLRLELDGDSMRKRTAKLPQT